MSLSIEAAESSLAGAVGPEWHTAHHCPARRRPALKDSKQISALSSLVSITSKLWTLPPLTPHKLATVACSNGSKGVTKMPKSAHV